MAKCVPNDVNGNGCIGCDSGRYVCDDFHLPPLDRWQNLHFSEHSNWIERRAGAATDRQRCGRQQELPSVPRRSGVGKRLEIAVVE